MNSDVIIISGPTANKLHFAVVISAFTISLLLALKLHYLKVVKNSYYGYPQEWIPSVSAVIGDCFPERNIFQLLMALAGIFRMALLVMSNRQLKFYCARRQSVSFWAGFARMWLAGFWIYCPSKEWNTFHDLSMIFYLISTVTYHQFLLTAKLCIDKKSRNTRICRLLQRLLLLDGPILILFFILHRVYRIPGAYSLYAFFEWFLVAFDVLLDYHAYDDLLRKSFIVLLESSKLNQ